jgi:endonuclease/exonuclease/phosphatase family metal-dependent hydrolase
MSHRFIRRALGIVGIGTLLLLYVAAVVALPAVAHGPWLVVAVAALLVGCLAVPAAAHYRRTRRLFAGLLACWLGLLAWEQLSRGGVAPAEKTDASDIRVVTWNIHCGQDEGPPWQRFDWPARKHALRAALEQTRPDVLCVQEARPGQVAFLEQALPGYTRVGQGRDGNDDGEHCAIWYDRARFRQLAGDTFWLEEPIDAPQPGSAFSVKRICTRVRLLDQESGRVVCVYNSHFPLTEGPRREASRIILDQIAAGDSSDSVILTADFNAPPTELSRRRLTEAGLADSASLAGERPGKRTFHLYGIPLRSIDAILVGRGVRVDRHHVLDVKPGNVFPSDHFGLVADVSLNAGSESRGTRQ